MGRSKYHLRRSAIMIFALLVFHLSFSTSEFNEPLQVGKSNQEWKSRIIYQVLTDRFARSDNQNASCNLGSYCGGTYRGILNHLDYIKNLGMNAIWISPIVENTGGSYHGYHATNWYALNTNFGSAADLKELIAACKAKDIWMMVDLVFNHVGPVGYDFGRINPFNKAEHYHDNCQVSDWNNQWQVENCRLSDLPDLKQENAFVKEELIKWAKWIIAEYSLDGIRIDTVKHIPIWFWQDLIGQIPNFYMLGEVFDGNVGYLSNYTKVMPGQLSYPMYYTLINVFANRQSCYQIRTRVDEMARAGMDWSLLGGFIDNHDNRRWLNLNGDWAALKNALLYNLYASSIPLVYYGTEQGFNGGNDPQNREPLWRTGFDQNHELYKFTSTAAKHRLTIDSATAAYAERYVDDTVYAFSRGTTLVVTTNVGSNSGTLGRTIAYLPWTAGTPVKELFSGKTATASANGLSVVIEKGMPQIWVKA